MPRLPALPEPVEHPHRAERVPPARRAFAVLHPDVGFTRVDVPERPPAVGIPIALDDPDRLGDALVGLDVGVAQVLESAQDVVVIPVREREAEPAAVDHLAGRLAAEQTAFQHVFRAAAA
jgi:hypothetical protein